MTRNISVEDIARLRAVYAAWEPYLPSSHRDFEAAAREAFPALLDLAEEALRLHAAAEPEAKACDHAGAVFGDHCPKCAAIIVEVVR